MMKKKAYALQLSSLRKARGLTQQQVAEAIGITRGRLNNYEQGSREPDIEIITLLANFYRISVGNLLGLDETEIFYRQNQQIREAIDLLEKVKNLSPEKQQIIELLTKCPSSSDKAQ